LAILILAIAFAACAEQALGVTEIATGLFVRPTGMSIPATGRRRAKRADPADLGRACLRDRLVSNRRYDLPACRSKRFAFAPSGCE